MKRRILILLAALCGAVPGSHAQSVAVTLSLDAPSVPVGQGTTLHVFAQVLPNLRTNADRIFSWYVDVLNTNGTVASASYGLMQKTASDQDPQTSSTGLAQGANRIGIYDTFINRPGAGVTNAVELMSIPVSGLVNGRTRFVVRAGTGVPQLSTDFLVAPKGGGPPLAGGDYTSAFVDLLVGSTAPCDPPPLHLIPQGGAPVAGGSLQITFTPCPGRSHTVEFRSALGDVAGWQPLPGAPHNSGSVTVTNTTAQRFFRLHVTGP